LEQAPPRVSCTPTSSATTVINASPVSARSTDPVVSVMRPWRRIVSGAEYRTPVSAAA
jgi:hypothetical protein